MGMLPNEHQLSGFTREQKIGFIFMLIFAILTVGLGGLQLRNTIYGPFVIKPKNTNPIVALANNADERLKNIDTDQDGLNDFEELNQYETSPYLPDSDSDGVTDKAEIDRGTDPLCAEDKVCLGADNEGTTPTSTVASPLIGNGLTPVDVLQATQQMSGNSQAISNDVDLAALVEDPVQLRAMILSTGRIDQATLDKIDDAALQAMAKKLLANPEAAVTQNTTTVR